MRNFSTSVEELRTHSLLRLVERRTLIRSAKFSKRSKDLKGSAEMPHNGQMLTGEFCGDCERGLRCERCVI